MEGENTPGVSDGSKLASLQQKEVYDNDSLSYVNLSNQKMDSSGLDIGEPNDQHLFSKTTTNEFLAVNNQKSAEPYYHPGAGNYVAGISHGILDSQTSSPAVKSDIALRTTAQFTHMQMPKNVNIHQDGNGGVYSKSGKQTRAPAHQQVLAASSALPGHHLKSASGSTSQTNYFNGGYNSAIPHKQMSNFQAGGSAQGRTTEAISRKTTGKLNKNGVLASGEAEPLQGLGQGTTAARSAVLSTAKHNANGREIKKISSKTKGVSEKARKRQGAHNANNHQQPMVGTHESALNIPNEVFGYHHQASKSHTRHVNRNLPGQVHGQNLDLPHASLQQSTQNTDNHNTPQQNAHAMFLANGGPPMPTGDQYQGFSFMTPIGQQNQNPFQFMQPGANGFTAQQQLAFPMQPQPQVFIAKQQKFYGISPDRAPLIFKQGSNEKRPYTSSGQMIGKRSSKASAQSQAIAALYMGSKTHNNGFGVQASNQKQRNQSQPISDEQQQQISHHNYQATQAAYSMQNFPQTKVAAGKQLYAVPNQTSGASIYIRKQQQVDSNKINLAANGFNQKMPEQLYEEVLKFKQNANNFKEENMKLKTKIKILENELGRKERTLEDFLQQNQFIQNAQKNAGVTGNTLAPIIQTAQRYQAETYLIMSLKKQVKEQKTERTKVEEELAIAKKTVKNTKFFEMDQEIKLYKDELIRLRYLLEQAYSSGTPNNAAFSEGAPSARPSTQNLPFGNLPFSMSYGQNQSQPAISQIAGNTFKSTSHTNFFPDTTSNLSHHISKTASQKQQEQLQYNLQIDDQLSNQTNDILPPLTKTSVQVGATAISNVVMDTRENEFVQKLTAQISEKDSLIRKLQSQVEDFSRQRLARLQNVSEGKGGSAGPVNAKTELARVRKQLREREKEMLRLRGVENSKQGEAAVSAQDNELLEKRVKQLQGQVNTQVKKAQEMKSELKKKDEKNEQLASQLTQVSEHQKQKIDKKKKEITKNENENEKKLQAQLDEMTRKVQDSSGENERLNEKLQKTLKQVEEVALENTKKQIESENVYEAAKKPVTLKESETKTQIYLDPKAEGEIGLISTVLGCRENRDRIEFAQDLKDFVKKLNISEEEEKKQSEKKELQPFGLASDYKLNLSQLLKSYIKDVEVQDLARIMPKYEFISPSLALIIMQEIRKMLIDPELFEILEEKESEIRLPFDALRDLCSRFDRNFTDEHCAFVTASYLTEIDEGFIYINFQEFLADLKDVKTRDLEMTGSKHRATSSIGSEGSDSEIRRMMMRAGIQTKSSSRSGGNTKVDEEHMLDIAESIFIKMADLMSKKSRSVRGIFTKYSVPEIFPDRTILELLSPAGFLEGIKDTGIGELQEFEIACLMRVLSKPELDNSVILNEFVMIMENFGVMDQLDDDDSDDYIPDTEQSVSQSMTDLNLKEDNIEDETATEADTKVKEDAKQIVNNEQKSTSAAPDKNEKEGTKDDKKDASKERKPRLHNMANIDEKGVKILRKVARFLLKQFLHPREFFGKAITKDQIKTKKRDFNLDVLKFKDFYLRIKIANIRKRLVENESLNNELCLDRKTHKDLINVKIMVKTLEELAEEEQKALIEEEKVAAEKLAKEIDEQKKETIGASDVDTPRSGSKSTDPFDQNEDGGEIKGGKTEDSKDNKNEEELKDPKDTYGLDPMKFGNAAIRSKNNGTQSPLLGERQFANLITIEEDKNETQTSNYIENASEQDDSKLQSSNQFRGSNFNGEFDLQKMSPNQMNNMLSKSDKQQMSASQVASSVNDIDQINANVDLPDGRIKDNEVGRLTGRASSWKEQQLSKSLAETSIERFKNGVEQENSKVLGDDSDKEVVPITPLTVQDKLTDGLPTPEAAPVLITKHEQKSAQE